MLFVCVCACLFGLVCTVTFDVFRSRSLWCPLRCFGVIIPSVFYSSVHSMVHDFAVQPRYTGRGTFRVRCGMSSVFIILVSLNTTTMAYGFPTVQYGTARWRVGKLRYPRDETIVLRLPRRSNTSVPYRGKWGYWAPTAFLPSSALHCASFERIYARAVK